MDKTKLKVDEEIRLFAGERLLVLLGLLGFMLAVLIVVYIGFNGATIPPEGNLESAFSFNAAFGLFAMSIAAIMPLAGLSHRKRTFLRWVFIQGTLYSYAVETIQHFRGINPRFSRAGTIADGILGGLFGLESLVIIVVTVLIAIPFYRKSRTVERPLLVLGIRYGFVSTMIAFAGGLGMIVLEGRYTGAAGNFIVLHGLGFHALQALPLLGWSLERANAEETHAKRLIHIGSIAWTVSILLIAAQTLLGRTVFEPTVLPLMAGVMLLVCLITVIIAMRKLLKSASGVSLFKLLKERGMER